MHRESTGEVPPYFSIAPEAALAELATLWERLIWHRSRLPAAVGVTIWPLGA